MPQYVTWLQRHVLDGNGKGPRWVSIGKAYKNEEEALKALKSIATANPKNYYRVISQGAVLGERSPDEPQGPTGWWPRLKRFMRWS